MINVMHKMCYSALLLSAELNVFVILTSLYFVQFSKPQLLQSSRVCAARTSVHNLTFLNFQQIVKPVGLLQMADAYLLIFFY